MTIVEIAGRHLAVQDIGVREGVSEETREEVPHKAQQEVRGEVAHKVPHKAQREVLEEVPRRAQHKMQEEVQGVPGGQQPPKKEKNKKNIQDSACFSKSPCL
jgi:hypothetical protein